MTIISNHRVHSYKFTTTRGHRDISPKKTTLQIAKNNKKNTTTSTQALINLIALIKTKNSDFIPIPSAPPADMTTRTICVRGQEYNIELPEGFDIYEGLRRWFPSLYKAVLEEQEEIHYNDQYDDSTDEDNEAAWAHYDYLEWLYD